MGLQLPHNMICIPRSLHKSSDDCACSPAHTHIQVLFGNPEACIPACKELEGFLPCPGHDITSAFLNADIHDDDTVLVTPPPILVKMDIVKPNTVWQVKKAIYGLREAPRLWQKERDQKLRDLAFMNNDKLVQSHIHPNGQPDCMTIKF